MKTCTSLFYTGEITYACHKLDAGSVNQRDRLYDSVDDNIKNFFAGSNDDVVHCRIYASLSRNLLTHGGQDKMYAIFQTTFEKDFLEWKFVNFD